MRVNHRGAHVPVTQQFLNSSNVISIFQEMRGEGVAKRVTGGRPRNTCLEPSLFDGFLQNGFMNVVAPPLSCSPIGIVA